MIKITPKDEAINMFNRFKELSKNQIFYNWDYYHKSCAIQCVKEMINEDDLYYFNIANPNRLIYLKNTIKELELLGV